MHGEIPNIAVGQMFADREECRLAGVHNAGIAGIAGYSGGQPAESIVVSGGYKDDEDHGNLIIYTGDGGRDPNTGKQIRDQERIRGNSGLYRSWSIGVAVRVIRSIGPNGRGKPYRYDGLYEITDEPKYELGRDGYFIYRFRLESISHTLVKAGRQLILGTTEPGRRSLVTQRIVRQTAVSNSVKNLHNYSCQICEVRISIPTGAYAEAAHIKPLGRPHDGPDVPENVLCLCPNCHVMFDRGAIGVAEDLSLINIDGTLRLADGHKVSSEYLAYHRTLYKLI